MKSFFRIFGVVAVIVLIVAAIVASTNSKPSNSEIVWDKEMIVGDIDAKNYFIIYSDLICPYCVAFENAIIEHEDDFKDYIADNDILVEVRLSDFLYEYGETNPKNSRYSAVATYCAKNEGRFWDYYNKAISRVWNDYYKDGGKSAVTSMSKLNKTYWIDLGKEIGLGDDFVSCVQNDSTLEEVEANAAKTAKLVNGMPYFKFNNFTSSGFDVSWGYDYVLQYFQAGLES